MSFQIEATAEEVAEPVPPPAPRAENGEPLPQRPRVEHQPVALLMTFNISDTKLPLHRRKAAQLVKPNATRWSSDFNMARRIFRLQLPFLTAAAQYSIKVPALHWLEPYLRIMEPVRQRTVHLQQERVPTLGLATFRVKNLFNYFRKIAGDASSLTLMDEVGLLQVTRFFRTSECSSIFRICVPLLH